jgi:hypothetical protein
MLGDSVGRDGFNNLIKIFRKISIERGGGTMSLRQGDGLGEQSPLAGIGRTYDGHRPSIVFDDNFVTGAYVLQDRSEIARCFRIGNVNYVLDHTGIIPVAPTFITSVDFRIRTAAITCAVGNPLDGYPAGGCVPIASGAAGMELAGRRINNPHSKSSNRSDTAGSGVGSFAERQHLAGANRIRGGYERFDLDDHYSHAATIS